MALPENRSVDRRHADSVIGLASDDPAAVPRTAVPPLNLDAELGELQAARMRRRAWRQQANAEHQEARQHGLRIRYATKLAALARAARDSQNKPEATT